MRAVRSICFAAVASIGGGACFMQIDEGKISANDADDSNVERARGGIDGGPSTSSDASPSDDDAGGGATSDSRSDVYVDPGSIPMAAWSFDETSGTIARDSSGHGRDAVLTGDATFVADGARGRVLHVNGDGKVVASTFAAAQFPRSGTISLWLLYEFNPSDTQDRNVFDSWDDQRPHLFVRRKGAGGTGGFQAALQYATSPGSYSYAWVSEFTLPETTWIHLVFTWNETAKEAALYRDGNLVMGDAYKTPSAPTQEIVELGGNFVGKLDEVRVYDHALAPADVKQLP